MAALPKQADRIPMSEGEHVLRFLGAEVKRVNSQYPDGKENDGKCDVLIWRFMSLTAVDDHGLHEEVEVMTPPGISGKNKTGKLAVKMDPAIDPDTDDFDPADYEDREYDAYIVHEQKGDRTYANIAKLKPVKKSKAAAKPAATEDRDPFADE